ncbi:MAG TPA: DUF4139 domain-containing protein [Puia sp.]|jgi:TonB-dependent SusC/RagA subfamily outer membrane receptor|nr:DUF4139 domain-containing protein [Puia sp.]
MKKFLLLLLSFLTTAHFQGFSREGAATIPSILRSATVYRTGAELTHTAKTFLRQGSNELIIEDISNNIDINSLRIGTTETVTILSVEFSKEYLRPETKSPLVKKLQDSLDSVQKELEKVNVLIRADMDLINLLESNKKIGGEQNGLSVAELIKMMDYYKQKSLELNAELTAANTRAGRLKTGAAKLEAQIDEEEKKNTRTSGRLLLQLLSPLAGEIEFTVSYLTPTASWTPSYDLRVDNINDPLRLLYKAKLRQTSGFDWKQVKLTLSTSVPTQGGNAPVLKTWFLRYTDPVSLSDGDKYNSLQSMAYKKTDLQEVVVSGYSTMRIRGTASDEENKDPLYIVNGKPMSEEDYRKIDTRAIKNVEVLKDAAATSLYGSRAAGGVVRITLKDELGDYVSVKDNTINVNFDIDLPYDVPTNGKEQNVVLKEYKVPTGFKYYSAPRLDKDAYLLGEVPDWGKLNLLPGEANIIFEGTYIGRSFIDPASTQDTLNLTLGRDRRVVIKREKVVDYSSVKFLGSNKKQIFTYEITVKNNKKEAIQLLLKDQYPISSSKEIEEELLDSSGAEVNTGTGVLTWKLQLAPGETKKYKLSYSVKYAKDKTVNVN